jgi:2-keto-4-pentenoate hydratase
MVIAADAVIAAADRLAAATASGIPCSPINDLLGLVDIDAAYRTQSTLTERRVGRGARIIGKKIGLTSAAIQAQVGVDRPDFGVLFDDMRFEDDEEIPFGILLQPRAEAEVAFLLSKSITDASDHEAIRDAIALQFPAIEVVDSRVANWKIQITDTVADNASSGVFMIGTQGYPLDAVEPVDVVMRMLRNGEVVSTGEGPACLGDPLNAVAWLAETMIGVGTPLQAGDIVLSGALGPMVSVTPGDVFVADIQPLGKVTARFSSKESSA